MRARSCCSGRRVSNQVSINAAGRRMDRIADASSELPRLERVALGHVACLEAALEPRHALRAGAVGEGLGLDGAARLALQRVVADLRGGIERLFDVALLQHLPGRLRAVRPAAGET